jgi:hypothetical protein
MLTIKRFDDLAASQAAQIAHPSSPFQTAWFQDVFVRHFRQSSELYILGVYEGDELVARVGFERMDDRVVFIGMK